jgi:hypothetical protein
LMKASNSSGEGRACVRSELLSLAATPAYLSVEDSGDPNLVAPKGLADLLERHLLLCLRLMQSDADRR